MVRPASETVTATSARSTRRSASRRASVVPPRMRMRRMSFGDSLARETAAPRRWLSIVGIGEDGIEGLTPPARSLVQAAEMVFGGPRETVTVPALSTFSLAAARLGWALPDTPQLSLHGRALDLVRPHLQPGARVLALTSDGEGPAALARLLAGSGFGRSRLTVLEALGGAR